MSRILIISPFNIFPPCWGGASRIYNLVKHLARNNEVTLLYNDYDQVESHSFGNEELQQLSSNPKIHIVAVRAFSKASQILNPLLITQALQLVKRERPDFLLAEFAWSGLHAMLLQFFSHVPYVLDEHNVEFLRFERMKRGNMVTVFILKSYERLSCLFAHKILCVSDVDKDLLISKLGARKEKIVVVPNGVDTDKFYPDKHKRKAARAKLKLGKEPTILFFGKLDYKPNYEAVKIIRYKVLPKVLNKIQNARFLIVGDAPPVEYGHENIIFTGLMKDIEDYINAADVAICPLASGGGTRIKILEAIACGKPVVSTSIGAEGINRRSSGDKLIVVDGWNEFSIAVANVLTDSRNIVVGDDLPKVFTAAYSWKNIGSNLRLE